MILNRRAIVTAHTHGRSQAAHRARATAEAILAQALGPDGSREQSVGVGR